MKGTIDLKPDSFKIISDSTIDLGNDCFLSIIDMGNRIIKMYAHRNGSELAGLVNAIQSSRNSIEDVLELVKDSYYLKRIEQALYR